MMTPLFGGVTSTGVEAMSSLFGESETEMEALLAMLPSAADSQAGCGPMQQDDWMSNWLKEEPNVQGVF